MTGPERPLVVVGQGVRCSRWDSGPVLVASHQLGCPLLSRSPVLRSGPGGVRRMLGGQSPDELPNAGEMLVVGKAYCMVELMQLSCSRSEEAWDRFEAEGKAPERGWLAPS